MSSPWYQSRQSNSYRNWEGAPTADWFTVNLGEIELPIGQWRPKLDKRIDRRLVLVRMYLTVTTTRPPPQHQLQSSSFNFRTGLWSGLGSGQLIPQQVYQTQVRVLCLRVPTTHNGTLEQHGNVFPFSQVNKTYLTAVLNNLEGTTKKPVTRQQKRFFQKEEMKLSEGIIKQNKILVLFPPPFHRKQLRRMENLANHYKILWVTIQ